MNTHSSGYYSIDKDYNILSYNDTAKQLYPNKKAGSAASAALHREISKNEDDNAA